MPDRLKRLNRELAHYRTKDYDNDLWAVSKGYRFRVSVFRHPRAGFVATCKAAGHVHRYQGQLPSDAFTNLVNSLKWVVSRLDYERRLAEQKERESMEA